MGCLSRGLVMGGLQQAKEFVLYCVIDWPSKYFCSFHYLRDPRREVLKAII
jgi:hypothetical protein